MKYTNVVYNFWHHKGSLYLQLDVYLNDYFIVTNN